MIRAEIVELSVIKSTYTHFLASYEAQVEVENATQVEINKVIISEHLQKLYTELYEWEALNRYATNNKYNTKDDEKQTADTKPNSDKLRMKFEPYIATELEERAIIHFNSDKRFKITEWEGQKDGL